MRPLEADCQLGVSTAVPHVHHYLVTIENRQQVGRCLKCGEEKTFPWPVENVRAQRAATWKARKRRGDATPY